MAILLSRDSEGKWVTLVGMRHPKSRFLGGFFAFPGGAHDAGDGDLRENEAKALRRTAARELHEETGLQLAPEKFFDAGRRATPPFAPRGFDSLMLMGEVPRPAPPHPAPPPELLDLQWARPNVLLERWRRLEICIAPPVLPIVEVLRECDGVGIEEIAERVRRVNAEMEADGPRIEFVPDVLMVPLRTATLPPATHTNCYFIGSGEFVIVDPGSAAEDEIARLSRHVRRRLLDGARPAAVLLTHAHRDHVGGVGAVAREFGLPVWAHIRTLQSISDDSRGGRGVREIVDGEVIHLSGGERLRAIETPGHAPGHLSFFEERSRTLFAGDLVSGISTILVESGPGGLDRYLSSLKRLISLDARMMFAGHGPPHLQPNVALQAVYDHRMAREEKIFRAVDGGVGRVSEIVRVAYADTPGANPGLAAQQTEVHLERLRGLGKVVCEAGTWQSRRGPEAAL